MTYATHTATFCTDMFAVPAWLAIFFASLSAAEARRREHGADERVEIREQQPASIRKINCHMAKKLSL